MVSARFILVACSLLAATAEALARDAEAATEPTRPADPTLAEPRLHHAPVSVAEAHQPLSIRAEIDHPELVRRVLLVYRIGDEPGFRAIEFLRASDGPYVAIIPEEHVNWPALQYAIELERTDGASVPVFATRAAPHRVLVPEDLMDIRERALYERHSGRRSVFAGGFEYVSFGRSEVDPARGDGEVSDYYWRAEGSYTYRPFRIVSEFGVRAGVLRGKAPVPVRELAPGQSEDERYDVGLNYGGPRVRFRAAEIVHFDGELVVGVTEVGFSWGGGGAILIGDAYGSKLTLGFESLEIFGTRLYSRMDLIAGEGVVVAPTIEVTDMPSADKFGVRLLAEVAVDVGQGFGVALRGGYQARVSTSGGPSAGATLSYAF
jgi:hypothetical protein